MQDFTFENNRFHSDKGGSVGLSLAPVEPVPGAGKFKKKKKKKERVYTRSFNFPRKSVGVIYDGGHKSRRIRFWSLSLSLATAIRPARCTCLIKVT